MTLSEAQASRRPDGAVRFPAGSGLPLLTRITFSTCRAPYPGGSMAGTSRWICAAPRAGFSQHRSGLPGPNYRSASTVNFSRFAQASLTLRPADLLTHHLWAWSEGFDAARSQTTPLLSYSGIPISS